MKKYIIKLYEYAELDEPARSRALDWFLGDGDAQYWDGELAIDNFIDRVYVETGISIDKNDFDIKYDKICMINDHNRSLNWLHYTENKALFCKLFKKSCNNKTLINVIDNYSIEFYYDSDHGIEFDYINTDNKVPRLERDLKRAFTQALEDINNKLYDIISDINCVIYDIQYDYENYTGIDAINETCTDNDWYFDKEGNFINIIDLEEANKDFDLEEEDQQ